MNKVFAVGTKLVTAKAMLYEEFRDYMEKREHGLQRVTVRVPTGINAKEDGYLVEHLDGGVSNHPDHNAFITWSPKEVFEDTYSLNGKLTYGQAQEFLFKGALIQRAGWNGKGLYIKNVRVHIEQGIPVPEGNLIFKSEQHYTFILNTNNGKMDPWVPSSTDNVARDWSVVFLDSSQTVDIL